MALMIEKTKHDHVPENSRLPGRMTWTLVLTTVSAAIEAIGGFWTGSLALLADAGHMATDAMGIGLSMFALWVATGAATPQKSWGYRRAEILAALVNGLILLGVTVFILIHCCPK